MLGQSLHQNCHCRARGCVWNLEALLQAIFNLTILGILASPSTMPFKGYTCVVPHLITDCVDQIAFYPGRWQPACLAHLPKLWCSSGLHCSSTKSPSLWSPDLWTGICPAPVTNWLAYSIAQALQLDTAYYLIEQWPPKHRLSWSVLPDSTNISMCSS